MKMNKNILFQLKPFLLVFLLQAWLAGMDIISKIALNKNMSIYVFVVYRHVIAMIVIAPFAVVLERKKRSKMTTSNFIKLVCLGLLEPVIGQILYFLGMKYTTATFAAAMSNVLPAITFIMACLLRMEKIRTRSMHSQAKIFGTVVSVGGAMMMTLLQGPTIGHPRKSSHEHQQGQSNPHHWIKGGLMIVVGCLGWAGFVLLQTFVLRTYPAELSITAWVCLLGAAEGAVVALVMERNNFTAWSIQWDAKLFAAAYSGIFCSGIAYYLQGMVIIERDPVFATAFSPLNMVIVAALSPLILSEQMYLGSVIGAVVIVIGLYLVVWGKQEDKPDVIVDLPVDHPPKGVLIPSTRSYNPPPLNRPPSP